MIPRQLHGFRFRLIDCGRPIAPQSVNRKRRRFGVRTTLSERCEFHLDAIGQNESVRDHVVEVGVERQRRFHGFGKRRFRRRWKIDRAVTQRRGRVTF